MVATIKMLDENMKLIPWTASPNPWHHGRHNEDVGCKQESWFHELPHLIHGIMVATMKMLDVNRKFIPAISSASSTSSLNVTDYWDVFRKWTPSHFAILLSSGVINQSLIALRNSPKQIVFVQAPSLSWLSRWMLISSQQTSSDGCWSTDFKRWLLINSCIGLTNQNGGRISWLTKWRVDQLTNMMATGTARDGRAFLPSRSPTPAFQAF